MHSTGIPLRYPLLALAALGIILTGCTDQGWSADQINESKRRGDDIIQSLESYRAQNGRYPARLDLLIPAYQKSIENPTTGNQQWIYSVRSDGQFFNLEFRATEDHPHRFGKSTGRQSWSGGRAP
jgi:hypothetical protein